MNEIKKDIDDAGRVVIPINFRRKLGIESSSKVLISCENDTIKISAANKRCVLCGKKTEDEKRLCKYCISKIKAEY